MEQKLLNFKDALISMELSARLLEAIQRESVLPRKQEGNFDDAVEQLVLAAISTVCELSKFINKELLKEK